LPLEYRRAELNKARETERIVALQLAAALSLDEGETESFTPLVREYLESYTGRLDLGDTSLTGLILAFPDLSLAFADDAISRVPDLPNNELMWLLVRTAESSSEHLGVILNEVRSRSLLPPFQLSFLEILQDNQEKSIPIDVKIALTHAAQGRVRENDVRAFGRWLSVDGERALLFVCAIASEPRIGLAALDTMAGRSIVTEPAKSLMEWVRSTVWERRQRVVKPFGILANFEIASESQINYAFDEVMPLTGRGRLFDAIGNSGKKELFLVALNRFGQMIPASELLELLEFGDKEEKIAALRALEGRNEVRLLQKILKAYDKEGDEEIRALYRQYHWVTEKR
jgi:hypothetical protein